MGEMPHFSFRLEEVDGNVHLSDKREHDTDGLDCWCRPTYYRICDCDGGCWRCRDWRDELSREDTEFCHDPLLVVHRMLTRGSATETPGDQP